MSSFPTKSLLWPINFKVTWLHMLVEEHCFHYALNGKLTAV